ncbi:MAG: metallophosphoesterase [Verrucomicrobiales bacterium]
MRIIYIIVIFCFPSISLGQEDDNIFSRSPYLQLATDSSIHIVWRTKIKINPIIRYGKDLGDLNKKIGSELILERRTVDESDESINDELSLFDAPKGTRQFEAKIPNLDPNSTYYYSVFDGEKRLTPKDSSYHFKTHPKPGTKSPLYFWVVGDSGTGGENQAKVHSAMRKYNQFKKLKLDMYIHVGDMAYNSGTDDEFSERFFKMYEPTLRNTVCWAAMGNHEGRTSKGENGIGPYYDAYICPKAAEAGGLPSGKEAYYSFDYGKVHFIVLDSHDLDRRPTGAMAQWLKADLEKTKAEWLVAYFHHPPYTKGSHDSDKEQQLIEMREQLCQYWKVEASTLCSLAIPISMKDQCLSTALMQRQLFLKESFLMMETAIPMVMAPT